MIPNFKEILAELSYRVDGGMPDLSKESHINQLIDILRENGVPDAAHLAQKARVYFSYLNEAKQTPLKKLLQQKVKNTDTGRDITVASALAYKDNKNTGAQNAYKAASAIIARNGYDEKDIDMVDDENPEEPNLWPNKKSGPKTVTPNTISVSGAEKRAGKSKTTQDPEQYQPTETQTAIFKGRKAELLDVIQRGFLGGEKKITSGVGAFEPDEEQLQALVDVTKKQLKNPSYRLKLPSYKIEDTDIDLALSVVENGLGPDAYQKWVKQVTNAGAVDTFLTSGTKPGSNGYNRFRAIVRKYMEQGGRSAITGKFVPFNRMQLDHHVPFGSAGQAVNDKKKKGIKTTIEAEKAKLDTAPNWDLMETSLNQFKNSLEGNDLINKAMKKLNMNPDEKELKKIKDEIKTLGRTQLFTNLITSFGKGDYSGFSQETLANLNSEDLQLVAKAWNYWHPDIKQNDTKNFAAADPNYLTKLKKAGIDIQKRDPSFVVRYKAQVGGSRSRSQAKKPDVMKVDLYNGMKKAGIGLSKKESIGANTALAKAILSVQTKSKELKDRERELKGRLKPSNTKK
jgi:hypothetical protein